MQLLRAARGLPLGPGADPPAPSAGTSWRRPMRFWTPSTTTHASGMCEELGDVSDAGGLPCRKWRRSGAASPWHNVVDGVARKLVFRHRPCLRGRAGCRYLASRSLANWDVLKRREKGHARPRRTRWRPCPTRCRPCGGRKRSSPSSVKAGFNWTSSVTGALDKLDEEIR